MAQSNTFKVMKGISSQTLVTIGLGIVEIVYFSIMSRLLTREDFGLFAALTAVTSIFYSISDAGIGSALIQRKEMTEEFKNTAFTLSIVVSGFVALLLLILSGPIANAIVGETLHYPLMLMATTIFFNGMISVNFGWLRRNLHFLKVGAIQLIAFIISSIIAILMAIDGYGFYAILFKFVASSLLTLIISFFFVGTKFRIGITRQHIKPIVHFGGWLTASVIIHNISSQIDRLLMSRLLSVEALGAYNRPKEFILQIGTRINGIFDTALFPVLSSIQDNLESLRNAFNRSQYFMNICSMALALSFICNAGLMIRIFFGEQWIDLKPIFQIIALTLIFNINGRLGDCYLRSLGFVQQQFNLRVFELIVDIICILIGFRFGIMGVAIGFLIGNIILICTKTIYLAWKMNISIRDIVNNVLGGWAYGFYFLPLIIVQYSIMPETWSSDILSAILFSILMVILFLIWPKLIGHQYEKEGVNRLRSFILTKIQKASHVFK